VHGIDTSTDVASQDRPPDSLAVKVSANIGETVHELHVFDGLLLDIGKDILGTALPRGRHFFRQSEDASSVVLVGPTKIIIGDGVNTTPHVGKVYAMLRDGSVHVKNDTFNIGEG